MIYIKFNVDGQPINKGSFTVGNKTYETIFYNSREDANLFMELNNSWDKLDKYDYGIIGKDSTGKHHLALVGDCI